MSTRSAIGFKTDEGWNGIYCHWDGYPTNRAHQIWELAMNEFILNKGEIGVANNCDVSKALEAFVAVYIKGHRGGWSCFPKECFCHSAEFVMRDGCKDDEAFMTQDTSDALFIEWLYIIDPQDKSMSIYTHGRQKGYHMEEANGNKWKQNNYTHYLVEKVVFDPDKPEPDWKRIEKKGSDLSNKMYERYKDEER